MSADSVPVSAREKQNNRPNGPPLFPLGRVVATPAALAMLEKYGVAPVEILNRHLHGDWGDLEADDRSANDAALKDGSRLLSAYSLLNGDRIWCVTEAVGDDGVSRASTCLLLPSEY